uniref:Uncharacterized protein n=1 Tax=Rhizophagus irregularis (strain DAOM 181602 / DAOM 197198 / MUCL 43194) TaxID=747089 RepID=U9SVV6_RHIID
MIRHNIDRSRISGPRNNSTNHDEKGALMILTDYSGDRLKALNSSQTLDSNYQLKEMKMKLDRMKMFLKSHPERIPTL